MEVKGHQFSDAAASLPPQRRRYAKKPTPPLPNYSLSAVCPACGGATQKLACKVRCPRCGFMWDCSEL